MKTETGVIGYKPRDARDGWQCPEAGEKPGTDAPSKPPEGTSPANTLISDFWPLALSQNKFLSSSGVKFVIICSSNPRKPVQCVKG